MGKYHFRQYSEEDYQKWLENSMEEDTPEAREWYSLEEDDRYDWMVEHPDAFLH